MHTGISLPRFRQHGKVHTGISLPRFRQHGKVHTGTSLPRFRQHGKVHTGISWRQLPGLQVAEILEDVLSEERSEGSHHTSHEVEH